MFAGVIVRTEACPMKKSHIASLQFMVNSCFAKIFNTRSKIVIEECQFYFNFSACSFGSYCTMGTKILDHI